MQDVIGNSTCRRYLLSLLNSTSIGEPVVIQGELYSVMQRKVFSLQSLLFNHKNEVLSVLQSVMHRSTNTGHMCNYLL